MANASSSGLGRGLGHLPPSGEGLQSANASLHLQMNQVVSSPPHIPAAAPWRWARQSRRRSGAGVLLGHAAAHQVEDGLLADAPDLGLMADIHASQRMSMAGIVSERLRSSSIRDSQLTLDLLPLAFGSTTTDERKFDTPPSRAMLLVEIWLVVFGAACTTLRRCPDPARHRQT